MKRSGGFLLALMVSAAPVLAQERDAQAEAARAQAEAARAQAEYARETAEASRNLAQLSPLHPLNLSFAQPFVKLTPGGQGPNSDFSYDQGMRELDNRKYDTAAQSFDRVIAAKSARADGALYWKAYALNRLGKRDEALAAVAQLRRDYPKSRWLNDAQALEVQVKQGSGKPISPADESNEDIKLIAINGLMNADPDRAVPLLEGILKGTSAPPVKDRAMFVLAQSQSPRAQQVLGDYARGNGNPDLQVRAIHYLGIAGTQERQQLLLGIYAGSTDNSVKTAVVQALFMAGAAARLVDLARKERDPEMKIAIVQQLSMMRSKEANDYMLELLK